MTQNHAPQPPESGAGTALRDMQQRAASNDAETGLIDENRVLMSYGLPIAFSAAAPDRIRSPDFDYWMRSISLRVLHRIVRVAAAMARPLSAADLNALVLETGQVKPARGRFTPGPTTLYHYRRAAEKLGLLRRDGRRFTVNRGDSLVLALAETDSFDDATVRDALSQIVIRCPEPRRFFFDLFMPRDGGYDAIDFMLDASPVMWQTFRTRQMLPASISDGHATNGPRGHSVGSKLMATLINPDTGASVNLDSPVRVSSLLYGVRYWAKDELRIIDEYTREGKGVAMFSVINQAEAAATKARHGLVGLLSPDREWSEFSVDDLVEKLCIPLHVSKRNLFGVIADIKRNAPGSVVTISVPPNLITMVTKTHSQGDLRLQDYMKNGSEYVGGVRLHADARRYLNAPQDYRQLGPTGT
jgi:hypothetical protein